MSLKKATEISILQYAASIGLNPEYVFYNRIPTNNKSTQSIEWTLDSPYQGNFMLDYGQYELIFPVNKVLQDADGGNEAAYDWQITDRVSLKEALPIANATSSATVVINGATQTFNQPRRWAHQLCMMFAGRKGITKCNHSGCNFWDLQGKYPTNDTYANTGNINRGDLHTPDTGLKMNEDAFLSNIYLEQNNAFGAGANKTIRVVEPILYPPWNPFGKVKKEMPDYCWFKHMSPSIANVSRLQLNLQLSNFAASMMFYRMAVTNDDIMGFLSVPSITTANLLLYWYKPPEKMEIPRQIVYQTWSVREFVRSVNNGAIVPNYTQNIDTVSDLIQLHSIPTLIVMSAKRDQDSTTAGTVYKCTSLAAYDETQPENRSSGDPSNNSMDTYMSIEEIEIQMADKSQLINTTIKPIQLYDMTLKNSIWKDFPYEFREWYGKISTVPDSDRLVLGSNDLVTNYPARCFLAFRPKDLGIGLSDGVAGSITLKVTSMKLRAHSTFPGTNPILNFKYIFTVHVFYGKHTLTLTPDSGKFEEQQLAFQTIGSSISESTASRIIPDDPRYISRLPAL